MFRVRFGESSISLARDIATVGSGTLMSRLVAFARDAGIAASLGAEPFSEAFFAMLQVINFFRRLLADGALNGAFVPTWLKLRGAEDGEANAKRFTWRGLLAMLCFTGIVALVLVVLAPFVVRVIAPGFDEGRRALTAYLLLLAARYILLAGLVAVIAPAVTSLGRLAILFILVALGLAIYTGALQALGVAKLKDPAGALRARD